MVKIIKLMTSQTNNQYEPENKSSKRERDRERREGEREKERGKREIGMASAANSDDEVYSCQKSFLVISLYQYLSIRIKLFSNFVFSSST